MARIEQKRPVGNGEKNSTVNKVFFGIGVGLLSAIAIFLIVILVMWIVGKTDKKKDDKEFEPTYTTENVISMNKLNKILDNDLQSGVDAEFIYVFIYSPDYDTYKPDENYGERLEKAIKQVSGLSNLDASNAAFFIVNVEDKDNKEWLADHEGFFANYGISTYPSLIKVGSTENGKEILNKSDMSDILQIITHVEKLIKDNGGTIEK